MDFAKPFPGQSAATSQDEVACPTVPMKHPPYSRRSHPQCEGFSLLPQTAQEVLEDSWLGQGRDARASDRVQVLDYTYQGRREGLQAWVGLALRYGREGEDGGLDK